MLGLDKDNSLLDIKKNMNPEDVFIRFQVYNSKVARGKKQETLIGQSLIQATRLIDLEEPQKST